LFFASRLGGYQQIVWSPAIAVGGAILPRVIAFPEGLEELARILADWSASAPSATIYLFGSRVRADHRPDSDVDIYIHYQFPPGGDSATVEWHMRQQETSFADLLPLLPGPLGETGHSTLDAMDKKTVALVMSGKMIYEDRNVRCVSLPPKPKRQAARI
jgi:Nucleotidyltransferase domain